MMDAMATSATRDTSTAEGKAAWRAELRAVLVTGANGRPFSPLLGEAGRPRHGTFTGYSDYGCGCGPCTETNARTGRQQKAGRQAHRLVVAAEALTRSGLLAQADADGLAATVVEVWSRARGDRAARVAELLADRWPGAVEAAEVLALARVVVSELAATAR